MAQGGRWVRRYGEWVRRYGETGTTTSLGYVQSREYSRELSDLSRRVRKYREMRSDPAVDTALRAGEKLILGGQWTIVTEADGGDDAEVRDFLEDNLYPHLDQLLAWLMLAWQFGFSTVEPVFRYREAEPLVAIARGKLRRMRRGSAGRIWLDSLVHVLPESVLGFKADDATGELGTVEQEVYIEGVGTLYPVLPGWKALHAVHGREGNDFSGRSMLRSMFMPWDVKIQLLRSFAVHWDRFGVGTPHMQAGAGWQDTDYERAENYLRAYRSGSETFLITPPGGELSIFAGQEVTKSGPLDMLRYLDGSIMKVALAQILELGTTATGHRALGDTFLDMLETSLQGWAEYLALLIQQRIIVPLVEMNFGARSEYPMLLPSVVLTSVPEFVTMVSQAKSAGLLGWSAEDEARLRDLAELPAIDVVARQQEMDAALAEQQAIARAAMERGAKPTDQRFSHSPDYQRPELRPSIALAELEREVLLPRLLADTLDAQLFRVGSEVDEVLREVDAALIEQAADLADEGLETAAREAPRRIRTPDRLRRQLERVLRGAAQRARQLGERTVRDELERQRALARSFTREDFVAGPADAAASGAVFGRGGGPAPATILLQREPTPQELASIVDGEAGRGVLMELDRRENAARGALLRALREATGAEAALVAAVRLRVRNELEALSPAVTRQNLTGVVNVAFGVGRQSSAVELIDRGEVAFGVRSEVMDAATCEACARGDGRTFSTDELRRIIAPPFPDCLGRAKCRGLIIYVRPTERPASR